jgi:hypothetical protein
MRTTRGVLGSIVLCLGLVLLLAPPATAEAQRPFRAEFTGQAVFTPTSTPGVLVGAISGEGRAAHLGQVAVSSSELLDFVTAPGSLLIRDGRMVVVAANGDELRWSYEGGGPAPGADGIAEFSGTFVVTGGTGRFADAAGEGTFHGVGSLAGGASLSYTGTITY